MRQALLFSLLFGAVVACGPLRQAVAQTVILDDFEAGLRVENPGETDPGVKYLWNQYTGDRYGPDPGIASVTTSQAHSGAHSLQVSVTGGNIYMQFYPATTDWGFMHEHVQPPTAWTAGKYNAMRFWVKVPPQIIHAEAGHENVQLGTYVRAQDGERRSQGQHYYHFYNFKYTGEWEQVIFDSHPTHLVGTQGNIELGDVPAPFGGNWTYMDALTRFYFDGQGPLSATPANFYFDGYELFTRPANENIGQVYAMHSVYVPAKNEIDIGWSRRKDQDRLGYEVRYAFQDINTIGWNAATRAPNGIVPGNGLGPYNVMEYSTQRINIPAGTSTLYLAIKPQNAATFRQITVEISPVTLPEAPTSPATR
jgi:hypothetical protein